MQTMSERINFTRSIGLLRAFVNNPSVPDEDKENFQKAVVALLKLSGTTPDIIRRVSLDDVLEVVDDYTVHEVVNGTELEGGWIQVSAAKLKSALRAIAPAAKTDAQEVGI